MMLNLVDAVRGQCPDVDPALGVMDDYEYTAREVNLEPGDAVFLCTDGIMDARNMSEEEVGAERLRNVVTASKPSAVEMGQTVLAAVEEFATSPDQFDDLTLVSFSRAAR